MSPFISQVLAILTSGSGSAGPIIENEALKGTPVVYYLKSSDEDRVTTALKKNGISFTQLASKLPESHRSNAIYCGAETPATAIKALATALMSQGIGIVTIRRIDSEAKNILYVVARSSMTYKIINSRPLSQFQINEITGCPTLHNVNISNFSRFNDPRPTGRSTDNRFVDIWFDQNLNQSADSSARAFCISRGSPDAVAYSTKQVEGTEISAVRMGDKSVCTGSCTVFQSIDCE